ncbi:hypothetical protein EDD18DRAFT_1111029 [Armillaria luteobubalina]|uniref:Uncharacterized protein n=1 Tax=Armillaria luteobubalina TaxID=153913 RepID=A0AA39UF19_9AGAR|nr:hypothetical protein EDD18DRAFT_1111029 [Armillaria luteobubalina]
MPNVYSQLPLRRHGNPSLQVTMQEDLSLPDHLLNAKHQCHDSLSSKYSRLARQSLPNDVPPNRSPFIDPPDGRKDEVDGLSRLAEHVLMMWGEVECLGEARDAMRGIYGDVPSTSGGLRASVEYPLSTNLGLVREPRIVEWFARVYVAAKEKLS